MLKVGYEGDTCSVEDDLAFIGEIDCYLVANVGLHLSDTPLGLVGMSNEHSRR